jgi:hypothetical protein
VVDPDDSAAFARQAAALACRRAGRVVVHTSPGPRPAWRLGVELLCALGKHWDRYGQRCDIAVEVLCRVWLRAEQVTDLVVLRAHQITSKAMAWLLTLLAGEQVRVWLCAPTPLVDLAPAADAAVARLSPAEFTRILQPHPPDYGCEDLNRPPPAPSPSTAPPPLTMATSRLLRQLHDPELAALGAAALLLGRPDPADQAAARVYVTEDAHSITTADERVLQVPEHARGLLCGWSWRELLPPAWALDVAETYLVLRLEEAGRYVGLPLLDPAYPMLPPTAWHERTDPGAELLAWLTRSRWIG